MQVTMLLNRFGPSGTIYAVGQTYEIPDQMAWEFVAANAATVTQAERTREEGSGSPVSGDVEYADIPSMLATAPAIGTKAIVTGALVVGGETYTEWRYTAAGWRLRGVQTLFSTHEPSVGVASASEQILRTITIPAGLLLALRNFRISWTGARSGTTDALTMRLRIGSAGATTDTLVAQDVGLSSLRTRGYTQVAKVTAATNWRYVHNGAAGWGEGSNSSAMPPLDTTIASASSVLYLSITTQMAGTTDVPSLGAVLFEGR